MADRVCCGFATEHLLGNSCDFKIVNLFFAWCFISVFYVYKDGKYKDNNKLTIRPTLCETKLLIVDNIWIFIKILQLTYLLVCQIFHKFDRDPLPFFTFYRDK